MKDSLKTAWSTDYVRNAYLRKVYRQNGDNHYNSYLYPFAEPYYGIHHPIVLLGSHDYDFLKTDAQELVTLRDGLIPLSYFFLTAICNPRKTYLIPVKFEHIVPSDWRKHVKLYRTVSLNESLDKKRLSTATELCIFGTANSTFAPLDVFEDKLDEFLEQLALHRKLSELRVRVFFSNNQSKLWGQWSDEVILDWSRAIFKRFGFDVVTMGWGRFSQEFDLRHCIYHEINTEHFLSDTYTKTYFLSRGAVDLSLKPAFDRELIKRIPLSRYHGVDVLEPCFESKYESPMDAPDFVFARDLMFTGLSTFTTEDEEEDDLDQEDSIERWDSWFVDAMASYAKINRTRHRSQ